MKPAEQMRRVLQGNASEEDRRQLEAWLDKQSAMSNVKDLDSDASERFSMQGSDHAKALYTQYRARRKRRRAMLLAAWTFTILVINFTLYEVLSPKAAPPTRFENAPLSQVFSYLQDEYKIAITVTNQTLLDCKVSCTLYRASDIDKLVEHLAIAIHGRAIKSSHRTFIIDGQSCNGA